MTADLDGTLQLLSGLQPAQAYGKVSKVVGLVAEGKGIKAPLGSICQLLPDDAGRQIINAEVVGFRDDVMLLMPYGEMRGIRPGSLIRNTSTPPVFPVGHRYLGHAVDAFGQCLDPQKTIFPARYSPLHADPPNPLTRPRITAPLDVGVRAINGLLTLGKGQRIGIMAGSGVGKSTLMGMFARYTSAEVNVIGLIGERGREVLDFIEKDLGPEGLAKSVLVVATSDQGPLVRMRAAYAATAMAEFFRDEGKDVLLMMDSVTRFAMAAREVGLAAGEPPTTRGYTPTVFSHLPRLLERAGRSSKGSITGIYTVLVEGDDMNEPIADTVRSILDGHVVLNRKIAHKNRYPAVDVLQSVSRLFTEINPDNVQKAAGRLRNVLATFQENEDLINIGAYAAGSSKKIDYAIARIDAINDFLTQGFDESASLEATMADLGELVSDRQGADRRRAGRKGFDRRRTDAPAGEEP